MTHPLTQAEVTRLTRMPHKTCPRCHQTKPNNQGFFPTNPAGRIMRMCLECHAARTVATKAKVTCPVCRALRRCYRDHDAREPTAVLMCRPCLMLVNAVSAVTPHTLTRALDYARKRKNPTGV